MSDVKLVRFAAVIVVLASYVLVFRTGEARITDRLEENARIMDSLRAAQQTVAARPRLETERRRLRAHLHAVDLDADRGALVARFVRDAARIATAHRTTIAAITASGATASLAVGAAAVSSAASSAAPSEPLQTIPLEVTVDGRYADVLATVRALSAARVLAAVDVASLARKNAAAADPAVTAVIHVALQHSAPAAPAAHDTVSAPPPQADVRTRPV